LRDTGVWCWLWITRLDWYASLAQAAINPVNQPYHGQNHQDNTYKFVEMGSMYT